MSRRSDGHPPIRASRGPGDLTHLLLAWRAGDSAALRKLFPLVYDELWRRVRRRFGRERKGHTLQPTAVVHEVYARLAGQKSLDCTSRAEFFAVATRLIREVLVDHARKHGTRKRGGDRVRIDPDENLPTAGRAEPDLLDLNRALDELAAEAPREATVVELRYILGYSIEEVAAFLEISPATVKREWQSARAWLYRRLRSGGGTAPA